MKGKAVVVVVPEERSAWTLHTGSLSDKIASTTRIATTAPPPPPSTTTKRNTTTKTSVVEMCVCVCVCVCVFVCVQARHTARGCGAAMDLLVYSPCRETSASRATCRWCALSDPRCHHPGTCCRNVYDVETQSSPKRSNI
jgi:hypothetical protein